MSLYRSLLVAVAAIAIASPVFADDTTPAATDTTTPAVQTTDTSTSQVSDATTTKLNINKATVKELMKVKGLNASKARAIVSYRKKHGDYKSIQDLAQVKGFKKVKLDTLENTLSVE